MNNIYLVGMMGSGKSTVGRFLSENLQRPFIDADDYLVKRSDFKSINEIFNSQDEAFFRKLEEKTMLTLSQKNEIIIATGGGVVLNPINIKRMHDSGTVIYIDVPIDILVNRLSNDQHRPLLKNTNLHDKLQSILNIREDLYQQAANYIISVKKESPREVSDHIQRLLKESL